jgi:hypothetical protein
VTDFFVENFLHLFYSSAFKGSGSFGRTMNITVVWAQITATVLDALEMLQSVCTTLQLTRHHLKRVSLFETPSHMLCVISPAVKLAKLIFRER